MFFCRNMIDFWPRKQKGKKERDIWFRLVITKQNLFPAFLSVEVLGFITSICNDSFSFFPFSLCFSSISSTAKSVFELKRIPRFHYK